MTRPRVRMPLGMSMVRCLIGLRGRLQGLPLGRLLISSPRRGRPWWRIVHETRAADGIKENWRIDARRGDLNVCFFFESIGLADGWVVQISSWT